MTAESLLTEVQLPAPLCMAMLFRMAFCGGDLRPLRDHLVATSHSHTDDAAAALISLSEIEQLLGDQARGLTYQKEALTLHRLFRSSWPTSSGALRVLAFKAGGDVSTNTPIEFLLENQDVVLYSLYVAPGEAIPKVPDHDIAVVTVGESDRDRPVMKEIERLIQTWPRPVLNRPECIIQLSRDGMFRLLGDIPGLAVPVTVRIDRPDLEKLGRGLLPRELFPADATFPMIVRPVDAHAGRGLMKLDTQETVGAYLATRDDAEFFLSPFVDYRSADGQFRKYRVVWIDGRPYPCHMAIADQWKIWYYNADMATSIAKRTEEEQFMSAFDHGFALRHAVVLAALAERIGLEYFGVDCAELPDGRLIVFEGDISLVVHDMDPPDLYPYKGPAMQKLFGAFYAMLKRRSR